VLEGEVVILPRDEKLADVFVGKGWQNHSVFELVKGWPTLRDGNGVSDAEFRFLRKSMNS